MISEQVHFERKETAMKKNTILCIGRQFGSGGRDIGQRIAGELAIPYYDKDILSKALKDTDLPADLLEKSDERLPNPMFRPVFYEGSNPRFYGKTSSEILFALQKDFILQKAKESSCVFVGRCADAILEKEPDLNVISVFIAASMDDRIERVMKRENLGERAASELIRKTDRQRKSYYSFFTDKDWGKPSDYDMVINSSDWSEEEIIKILKGLYEMK